jgi:hypothetical protein
VDQNGIPPLPTNFWNTFATASINTTEWHQLTSGQSSFFEIPELPYSGASVAGCPGRSRPSCGWDLNGDGDINDQGEIANDEARISEFELNPQSVQTGSQIFLFAAVDSPQDRVSPVIRLSSPQSYDSVPDQLAPRDNNITYRRVVLGP